MDALVRMNADELNESLIDFIKSSFKGMGLPYIFMKTRWMKQNIYYAIRFIKKLLQTVEEVSQRKDLKVYTLDELKTMFLNGSKNEKHCFKATGIRQHETLVFK